MSTRKLALLLIASAIFLPTLSRADSKVRIVRLSYVYGDVQVDRREGKGFERALLNLPLMAGDRLLTRGSARAEIEFEKGSTIRMMPATRIEFAELSRRDSGQPVTAMLLQEGTAYFNLHKKDGDGFSVVVGQHKIRLPKSARFRLQVRDTEAQLAVLKGSLEVASSASSNWVAVGKKETLTLNLDDTSRVVLAKGIAPLLIYDDWDKQIEGYRDNYAATRSIVFGYGRGDRSVNGYCPWGYLYSNPIEGHSWCWYPSQGFLQANGSRAECPPRGYYPQTPTATGGATTAGTSSRGPNTAGGSIPRGPGGRQPVFETSEPSRHSTGFSGGGFGSTSGSSNVGSQGGSSSVGSHASSGGLGSSSGPSTGSVGRMDGGSHSPGGGNRGGSQRVNTPR